MPDSLHTHRFKGVTVYIDGHLHLFSGVSSPSLNVPGHTHIISGRTTVNAGHSHPYAFGSQGPTYVEPTLYRHYHYFTGNTGVVMEHYHPMSGTTFVLGEP